MVCAQGLNRSRPTSHWPFTYEDVDYNRTRYAENFESLYSNIGQTDGLDDSRQMPLTIKYTGEEKERIDVIAQDLTTLIDENLHKVIMGLEPIENGMRLLIY